jgi:prolipoprotein diacylglyceryltransferase
MILAKILIAISMLVSLICIGVNFGRWGEPMNRREYALAIDKLINETIRDVTDDSRTGNASSEARRELQDLLKKVTCRDIN